MRTKLTVALISILTILTLSNAFAGDTVVSKVTRSDSSNVNGIILHTGGGEIKGMTVKWINTHDPKPIIITKKDMVSGSYVTLIKEYGITFAKMRTGSFDFKTGGKIVLKWVKKWSLFGGKSEEGRISMKLKKRGSRWVLTTRGGKRIKELHFVLDKNMTTQSVVIDLKVR